MSNKRKVFSASFWLNITIAIILLAGAITFGILGSALAAVVLSLFVIVAVGMAVLEYISSKNSPDLRLQNKLHELFEIDPIKGGSGQFFVPDTYTTENINQLFTEINQLIPEVDDESLEELIKNYFEILIYLRNSIRNGSLNASDASNTSGQNHQLFFLQKLNSTFSICVEHRLKTNTSLEKILDFMTGWFEVEHTSLFHQPFFDAYSPKPKRLQLLQLAPIELIATNLTNMILRELAINPHSTQIESYLNSAIGLFKSFNEKSLEDYMSVMFNNPSSANANVPGAIKTQFALIQKVVAEQLNKLTEEQKILATQKAQQQQPPVVTLQAPVTPTQQNISQNQVVTTDKQNPNQLQQSPAIPAKKHSTSIPKENPPAEIVEQSSTHAKEQDQKSPAVAFSPPLFATQQTTIQHTDDIWQKMRTYLRRYWGFNTYQDTADGLFMPCNTQEGANNWCVRINNRLGGKMVEPAMLGDRVGFLFKAENFPAILTAEAVAKAHESSKDSGCQFM